MSGRGRPSTGTRIEVRVPSDVLERIDRLAGARATTRAELVRDAVIEVYGDRLSSDAAVARRMRGD